MSARRAIGPAALVALCGCASDNAPSAGGGFCDTTEALVVTPERLVRGATETIRIRWSVFGDLGSVAHAKLMSGPLESIEVELPLATSNGFDYVGTVLNPYGPGAPPGPVIVLTRAELDTGCALEPSAAASFELE